MSDSQFVQGFRFLQEKQFSEAIVVFLEVLKNQPDLAEAHFNLGNAFPLSYSRVIFYSLRTGTPVHSKFQFSDTTFWTGI